MNIQTYNNLAFDAVGKWQFFAQESVGADVVETALQLAFLLVFALVAAGYVMKSLGAKAKPGALGLSCHAGGGGLIGNINQIQPAFWDESGSLKRLVATDCGKSSMPELNMSESFSQL